MQGVKPLKQPNRVKQANPTNKLEPKRIKLTEQPVFPEDKVLDIQTEEPVKAEEKLFYTTAGVQQRTLKQLKRGQMPVEAQLDLHGHTIIQAENALADFLEATQAAGLRCVRVVHGKGYTKLTEFPPIKNKVNAWLRSHSQVLSFCSAIPRDGGTGAVYILLKQLKSLD